MIEQFERRVSFVLRSNWRQDDDDDCDDEEEENATITLIALLLLGCSKKVMKQSQASRFSFILHIFSLVLYIMIQYFKMLSVKTQHDSAF